MNQNNSIEKLYEAAERASIVVQDKGNYITHDEFIRRLRNIWCELTLDQKTGLSLLFTDAVFNENFAGITRYRKAKQIPLGRLLHEYVGYERKHIGYDKITGVFSVVNIMDEHLWHFNTNNDNYENVVEFLNGLNIKPKTNIIDFLKQKVKINTIYIKTRSSR